MTLVAERPPPSRAPVGGPSKPSPATGRATRRRGIGRRIATEGGILAILFFGLYETFAWLLDWKYLLIE